MDRDTLIKKYEKIVKKWDSNNCLKEILPNTYKEIKTKLKLLKSGAPYRVYDATDQLKDMIMDMGAKIRDVVRIINREEMLGDIVDSKYEYKTEIPLLVDGILRRCKIGGKP